MRRSGQTKDQAGTECFGMQVAVENAETAVGELDDAPVQARNDGVVDAGEELVFEFRAVILAGAKVVVADAAETFQVGHEGQDVRMQGDAGADEAVVERGGLGYAENGAAQVGTEVDKRHAPDE